MKHHDGRVRHLRICAFGEVPIAQVRKSTTEMLVDLVVGKPADAMHRPRKNRLTIAAVFKVYQSFTREHRKPQTVVDYTWHWGKHLQPWADDRVLVEIRRNDVSAIHLKMGQEHGQPIANRVLALLRAMINRAIREYELGLLNPDAGINQYRKESRTRRLNFEELPTFFNAVHAEPNTGIRDFVLALFTDVRKSNLLAMRWEHLNLEEGLWTIPSSESKTSV